MANRVIRHWIPRSSLELRITVQGTQHITGRLLRLGFQPYAHILMQILATKQLVKQEHT